MENGLAGKRGGYGLVGLGAGSAEVGFSVCAKPGAGAGAGAAQYAPFSPSANLWNEGVSPAALCWGSPGQAQGGFLDRCGLAPGD